MPQDLEKRMENLEKTVHALEQLPARVDSLEVQVLRLGDEMRVGLSAIHGEIAGVQRTMLAGHEHLEARILAGNEETRRVLGDAIRAGDEETRRMLRDEIRTGDEETQRQMRVLHEEALARIALIDEGRQS